MDSKSNIEPNILFSELRLDYSGISYFIDLRGTISSVISFRASISTMELSQSKICHQKYTALMHEPRPLQSHSCHRDIRLVMQTWDTRFHSCPICSGYQVGLADKWQSFLTGWKGGYICALLRNIYGEGKNSFM